MNKYALTAFALRALARSMPAPEVRKSLRDFALSSDLYDTGTGTVRIVGGNPGATKLYKKNNVRRLRNYSQFSPFVRAAIDIYRATVERAVPIVGPIDKKAPYNKTVQKQVQALVTGVYADMPYAALKGMMVEDALVLGHGALHLTLNRGAQPTGFTKVDAAYLAFLNWDGNPAHPRFALLGANGKIDAAWANSEVMLHLLRPMSYDALGTSPLDVLDQTIKGLFAADEYFIDQVLNPAPHGLLNLGANTQPKQVSETRQKLDQLKKAIAIIGGADNASFTSFGSDERAIQALNTSEWFVKQVAAVFRLSVSALQVVAQLSRANADTISDTDMEGVEDFLDDIRALEERTFLVPYGDPAEMNLGISYALLNKRDERQQTDIATKQFTAGLITLNEGREQLGNDPVNDPMANIPLLQDGKNGLIPLSALNSKDPAVLYAPPPAPQLAPPADASRVELPADAPKQLTGARP